MNVRGRLGRRPHPQIKVGFSTRMPGFHIAGLVLSLILFFSFLYGCCNGILKISFDIPVLVYISL